MKTMWIAFGLLTAVISVGVACGPKEKFCYEEGETCVQRGKEIEMDAAWEAPEVVETLKTCFTDAGVKFTVDAAQCPE